MPNKPDTRPAWARHLPVLSQKSYDVAKLMGWRIADAALNQVYSIERRFLFWHMHASAAKVIYFDREFSAYVSHKMLERAEFYFDPARACLHKQG